MHGWVLIHHKYASALDCADPGLSRPRWHLRGLSVVQRQSDSEFRSAFSRRLVSERTAMGLYQAVAQRQTKSGPLARPLGGKEGCEQVRGEVLWHSRAGVADPKHSLTIRPSG